MAGRVRSAKRLSSLKQPTFLRLNHIDPAQTARMDSNVKYLLSLIAIRERARIVGDAAQAGKLNHFDLHEVRMDDVADFVTSVIKVGLKYSYPHFHNKIDANLVTID